MNKFRETDQAEPAREQFDFGNALRALKEGRHVARKEWGDTDVFLYMEAGCAYFTKRDNGQPINGVSALLFSHGPKDCGVRMPTLSISVRGVTHPGYVPPQFDMLAEDWYVL